MVEREPIVEKEKITFEGLFSLKDVIKLIEDWQSSKRYVPFERKAVESVRSHGKFIEYWFQPYRKPSDYVKYVIWIRLLGSDLKEKEVERDGHKLVLVEGKIQIIIDAFLETDWEKRWENKPLFYFLRSVWDKFIYAPFLSGSRQGVKDDAMHLKAQLKSYLNMQRFA